MNELYLFSILIAFCLILIIIGFFKQQYVMVLLGGIMLLVLGGFMLNGLSTTNGYTIVTVGNTTSIDPVIQVYHNKYNTAFSITIMVISLFLILISILKMIANERDEVAPDEDN